MCCCLVPTALPKTFFPRALSSVIASRPIDLVTGVEPCSSFIKDVRASFAGRRTSCKLDRVRWYVDGDFYTTTVDVYPRMYLSMGT